MSLFAGLFLLCLKNAPPLYILNNSAKNEPILILFGVQNPEGNFTPENCKLAYLTCVDNVATLPCEMQLI